MGTCRPSSADMKKFATFICLLTSQALAKPSKRAAEEGECCSEKRVGNVLYQLFNEGDARQLARYNCLNGCIYKEEEDPQGPSFCFAHGDLPVKCMDECDYDISLADDELSYNVSLSTNGAGILKLEFAQNAENVTIDVFDNDADLSCPNCQCP